MQAPQPQGTPQQELSSLFPLQLTHPQVPHIVPSQALTTIAFDPPINSFCQTGVKPNSASAVDVREAQHRAQRRILLLRHAKICKHAQADDYSEKGGFCPVSKQCGAARKLCRHVETCNLPVCPFPHCVTSRQLLLHYRSCKDKSCKICTPVKRAIRRSKEKQRKKEILMEQRSMVELHRKLAEQQERQFMQILLEIQGVKHNPFVGARQA